MFDGTEIWDDWNSLRAAACFYMAYGAGDPRAMENYQRLARERGVRVDTAHFDQWFASQHFFECPY